ncbi:MAG: hypothetical protein K9H64_20380 [Bacteroidales bacterium]|nr:hypothetical protein [Bacteroidales bacterium]MCF8458396.1 hypothetical protein [Bacteroidales bacterium]
MDEQKINREIEQLKSDIDIHKIDRITKGSKWVSIFVIPVLFILFMYGAIRLNKLYQEIEIVEAKKQAEQLKYESLQFENDALEKKKIQLETELMATYGLSIDSITSLSTSEVLEKSLSANDGIKTIVKDYSPNKNVIVRYYAKTIDDKRIAVELESLGYGFEEKIPTAGMSKKNTIALWYGAGVPIEDVKIVALALIRAGAPIKGIRPYAKSLSDPNYKRFIIEAGASVDLESNPLMTVDEIKVAKEFGR